VVLGQLAVVVVARLVVAVANVVVVAAVHRRLGVPPTATAHVALLILGIAFRLSSSAVQLVVGVLTGNVLAEGLKKSK